MALDSTAFSFYNRIHDIDKQSIDPLDTFRHFGWRCALPERTLHPGKDVCAGFFVFDDLKVLMRTYDKLIATIHPHQWMVGLRSSIGAASIAQDKSP
nr:hypothetical protein [uncultured Albidiferax sp.]